MVESVTKGVEGFQIVESGSDYKVNDNLSFDNETPLEGVLVPLYRRLRVKRYQV